MKKIFYATLMSLILTVSGCYVEVEPAVQVCYEEPPFYSYPDFCVDVIGGECCSWHVYDVHETPCFEEWCVWDLMCGWEYDGDYCPMIL